MNLKKASILFAGFLLVFLSAHSAGYLAFATEFVYGLIFGSGLLLGEALLHSGGPAGIRSRMLGVALGFGGFFLVGQIEAAIERSLAREPAPMSAFSSLDGHCGVSAGRALIRLYDDLVASPGDARAREYRIRSECRLKRLRDRERTGTLACDANESPMVCRVRWMDALAAEGNWDYETRKFFFETAMKLWSAARDDEGLVLYVMKDQEIQNLALNETVQAGGTSGAGVVELQKNDRIHNELSKTIFESVARAISKEGGPEGAPREVFRTRFREQQAEFLKRSSR